MLILLIAAGILGSAIAITYMWATRTAPYIVEEPLSIASFPSAFSTHPGENQTLDITIENSANINYSVTLSFIVDDTEYQQTYMEFSNKTYTISPGSNSITAWCATEKKAPPAQLSLTVEFYRE
jgi:hypothetical protein